MLVWVCACAALAAAGAEATGAAQALRGASRWAVASSVLLSDASMSAGELGYRLQAELTLRAQPLPDGLLLHFTLEAPQLMLRGKHLNAEFLPNPSIWDSMPSSEFLAVWSEGHITEAFLDPTDPPDVFDYKKSLISLFQFQVEEGERNETDVSGYCHVHYDPVSELVFRKSKMQCTWQGAVDEDEADGCVERRRATRYELAADGALAALAADEVLLLRGLDPAHALKARALHVLRRAGPPPPAPAPASLAAARRRLPALAPAPLPLELRPEPDDEPPESLSAALGAHRAAVEEAQAGGAAAAAAALRLLPAVRAAAGPQLAALLDHPDSDDIREGLVRMLGLAGTRGAHAAAREALQLAAREPPREALGREYLAALAGAPEVDEWVVRDTLQLGAAGGPLAPAALLAAAAACQRVPAPAREALVTDVKNSLTKALAKCKDDSCSAVRVQALGQLRRPELAELFLQQAETGGRGAALAALAALEPAADQELRGARRRRLEALALGLRGPAARAPDVRAAALQLALRAAADTPLSLLGLTGALRRHGPRELRRVCWLRLRQLAEGRPELALLLPALDPRPRDWARRAHDGTSSVLARAAGWARLDSAQLAAAGVLRRGAVRLAAAGSQLLTVELWTRGMESFATPAPVPAAAREPEDEPGAGAGGEEEEAVEGGLALTVAGVRRPDVTLFSGQGELLGHIWAGTGSSPTPLLRAALPVAAPHAHAHALQAGLVLRAHVQRALALAQDAQAQVSLWARTARAGLALRGAGVELVRLRARTAWGSLAAAAHAQLEPRLLLSAALDFYDRPQLCVHTELPDYTYSRNVTLESVLGARALRVRRTRVQSVPVPGRTLALGAPNDAACAALGADHRD